MPPALRTLALILMIALLPMRALAAVTVGFCAMGHTDQVVSVHGDHGHGAASYAHHDSDDAPAKPATSTCSSCVEHCSGAAFAPHAPQAVHAPTIAYDRIFVAERVAPAFISDQLDRPPLA
jgi:hypothetical protein